MELLPEEVTKALPPLYSQEHNPDPVVVVKFFTPDANWTWYAYEGSAVDENGYFDTEKEKVDFLFFGLIIGFETELGYFALSELIDASGPLGLPIERDLAFLPTKLSAVKALHTAS